MTGLKVTSADKAFADALLNNLSTDAKLKYTFASPGDANMGCDGQFCIYQAEKRDEPRVAGLAVKSLLNLSAVLEDAAAKVTLAKLNGANKIEAVVLNGVPADKDNLAKFILVSAAAQKINDAVLSHVGIFKRFWNFITCCFRKEETELTKFNNLFNSIITKCNTEYEKIATKDAPKQA